VACCCCPCVALVNPSVVGTTWATLPALVGKMAESQIDMTVFGGLACLWEAWQCDRRRPPYTAEWEHNIPLVPEHWLRDLNDRKR